jgi:hypothetical protein
MEVITVVASSALVSAVVGALAGHLSQRHLAERQAQLDYEFNARKRLYEAIGPLRFQLLLACRDLLRRVKDHHRRKWNMDPSEYYARSFVYRILRPIALGELLERQLNFADFSLDLSAVELLRFNSAFHRTLTGAEVTLGHPNVDWSRQTQHLFRDNLRAAALTLVDTSRSPDDTVLTYADFQTKYPNIVGEPHISALASLFANCAESLLDNPILWTRLVAYAAVCERFIDSQGADLGFAKRRVEIVEHVEAVDDEFLSERAKDLPTVIDALVTGGL